MSASPLVPKIDEILDKVLAGEDVGPGEEARVLAALGPEGADGPYARRIRDRERQAARLPSASAWVAGVRLRFEQAPADDVEPVEEPPGPPGELAQVVANVVGRLREHAAARARAESALAAPDASFSMIVSILDSVFGRIVKGRVIDEGSLLAALIEVAQRKYRDRHPGPAAPPAPAPGDGASLIRLAPTLPQDELPDELGEFLLDDCHNILANAPSETDRRVRIYALQELDDDEIVRRLLGEGKDIDATRVRLKRERALSDIRLLA